MELWIRNQNKLKLVKVNYVYAIENDDHYTIYGETNDSSSVIAKYKTKERTLEVLDEIQNILMPRIAYTPIVKEDKKPEYIYKHYIREKGKVEILELSTYVYQMPKK